MPCESDYMSGQDHELIQRLRAELDHTTSQLCGLCKHLEKKGQRDLIAGGGVGKWWERHKKLDAAREQREGLWRAKAGKFKAALAKLTSREREALNVSSDRWYTDEEEMHFNAERENGRS